MEELHLTRLTLRTSSAPALGRFLTDVLGAEVEPLSADHFKASLAGLCFDVSEGSEASPSEVEFSASAAFLQDLRSRWEFFCFRQGEKPDGDEEGLSYHDPDGRRWTIRSFL